MLLNLGDDALIQEVKNKQGPKNVFVKAKFDWRIVPGRDEAWAIKERTAIGDVKFMQEYECIDRTEQL